MCKQIGIVTVRRGLLLSNYGSFFQHYALRVVLKRLGYNPFRCEGDSIWLELWDLLMPLRSRWSYLRDLFIARKRRSITPFNAIFRRLSFIRCYKLIIGALFEAQPAVKCYVVGGDCVWFNTHTSMFLLDKPVSARKLSYAVSSSWTSMSEIEMWRELIRKVGISYAAISVRESIGCKIVHDLTGRRVVRVLDPVLLLDKQDYARVASRKRMFSRSTLLYYVVNSESEADLNLAEINCWAKKLDLDVRIIGIQGAESFVPKDLAIHPNPKEFLNLFDEAKCIVTNSFHGIVFSIVYNKPFVFIPQKSTKWGNQNQRQNELLALLSLEQRRVRNDESTEEVAGYLETPLPSKVQLRVSDLGSKSIEWLRDALSNGEGE